VSNSKLASPPFHTWYRICADLAAY